LREHRPVYRDGNVAGMFSREQTVFAAVIELLKSSVTRLKMENRKTFHWSAAAL